MKIMSNIFNVAGEPVLHSGRGLFDIVQYCKDGPSLVSYYCAIKLYPVQNKIKIGGLDGKVKINAVSPIDEMSNACHDISEKHYFRMMAPYEKLINGLSDAFDPHDTLFCNWDYRSILNTLFTITLNCHAVSSRSIVSTMSLVDYMCTMEEDGKE